VRDARDLGDLLRKKVAGVAGAMTNVQIVVSVPRLDRVSDQALDWKALGSLVQQRSA
jgi:hypothetical protein